MENRISKFFLKIIFIAVILTGFASSQSYFRLNVGPYITSSKTGIITGLGFNKYFDSAVSFYGELGLGILKREAESKLTSDSDNVTGAVIVDYQKLYLVPIVFGLQITMPFEIPVKPYLVGGIGINTGVESLKEEDVDRKLYSYMSFAWRLGIGVRYPLAESSNVFFESYFHRADQYRLGSSEYKLDLSGVALVIGIEFG